MFSKACRPISWVPLIIALVALVATGTVHADATPAPPPTAGSPGLPDGRVYEQVSPPDKNGNAAGDPFDGTAKPPVMLAEPGGDGVAYTVSGGSIGDTQNGGQTEDVAKRTSAGWLSDGAQPAEIGDNALLFLEPKQLGFSADLTQVVFSTEGKYLPGTPIFAPFLYDIADGSLAWLDPPPAGSEAGAAGMVAGFSTDMSTIYYRTATGFYESHDGVQNVAGVLPNGSVEPDAQPAGLPTVTPYQPTNEKLWLEGAKTNFSASWLQNQVSEDGTRAFFAAGSPTELYVRETAPDGTQSTVLLSRDTLLPDVAGLPAPAPGGALSIQWPEENFTGEALSTANSPAYSEGYLYASPDGSRAFFESTDALTGAARQAEAHGLPAGDAKEYMFDTDTAVLTYLPGVADAPLVELPYQGGGEHFFSGPSPILASSQDGSRFIFNGQSGLSLWSDEGSEGGTVTLLEPLPVGGEVRATSEGSVFVFESAAPFAGFNNGGSHCGDHGQVCGLPNQEIYRYDVAENSLTCVSCPPRGIVPSGNAYMSHDDDNGGALTGDPLNSTRDISEDGSRIFFDTPDPLVPQDVNTAPERFNSSGELEEHGRDVYEWENGKLFLISSGTSDQSSYLGDSSANGNDVFFSTVQGLVPGDTDEGYDVYDARVPRPGDRPPPAPAECEGEECQGPPSEPALLGAPASATFTGLGNPAPAVVTPPPPKKTTKKVTKCPKGKTRNKKGQCVKTKKKAKKAERASNDRRTQS
jgi:hypothetical protein